MRHPIAALLLVTTPAMAQITPDDLLDSWQAFYASVGDEFTFERIERDGETLTLINVEFTDGPHEPIEWVRLDGQQDGSVDISFSRSLENIVTTDETFGISSTNTFNLRGLGLNASGLPDAILYRFSIEEISTETIDKFDAAPSITSIFISGITGEILHKPVGGQSQSFSGFAEADSFAINNLIDTSNPQDRTTYELSLLDSRFNMDFVIPNDLADPEPGMPFPEGMELSATVLAGPIKVNTTEGGESTVTFTQQSGMVIAELDTAGYTYGFSSENGALSLQGNQPDGVNFDGVYEAIALELKIPFPNPEAVQDFSIATRLSGLNLAETMWQGLDPEASLPRTPLSFGFALTGTAIVNEDLSGIVAMEPPSGASFELRSIKLGGLSLDFGGLGVNGSGALSFNPERIDPMSGQPEPVGQLTFSINGALGLLDKIGSLALVDPMFILGAKGALGMFASPGNAPDSFNTTIEFIEGGSITINGQEVR